MIGPGQRRRAIRNAAHAAALGEVVRIHRGHGRGVATALWVLVGVGSVPAAIMTVILVVEESTTWQWPLLGWSALAGVALLVAHFAPVYGGRQWIAVAQGGVVFWQRDSVWTATWAEAPRLGEDPVCGLRDLEEASLRRAPVKAWTPRRVTSLAGIALFVAAATWVAAVPIARNYLIGDRPARAEQLERLCHDGRPFGRTAAYGGPAPHPAAVFAEGTEISDPVADAASVQLVACVVITSGERIKQCEYEDRYVRDLYRGQYRIDVKEARTGRSVGSFPIEGGKAGLGCGERIFVPPTQEGKVRDDYDLPDRENVRAHLMPFVDGAPR